MFDPRNEHVVIDSLLPFYPLKSSGYSIDDGFQTIAAWNHLPLRFSNHQSSFILVPHNLYIYIYTRKSTQIALESSIFTWSALYQPANFKATKRLLPTSKLTTGIAERVAPQALCWTWLPPTCHVGVLAQMETRKFGQACAVWESIIWVSQCVFGQLFLSSQIR